jgi:hypothetical protein
MSEPTTIYYPTEVFENINSQKTAYGKTTDNINRYCLFKCRDYKMKGKDTQEVEMSVENLFHIGLALPNDLGESITQNWTPGTMGLKGVLSNITNAVQQKLGGLAFRTISSATGITSNPAEELIYSGPEFRSFTFKFDLMPRSKVEENHVKLILLLFKKFCLPQMGVAEAFISFPAIWEIQINGIDDEEIDEYNLLDFGFKDKYFALTNYSVEYTPEGSFTSFHSGWPTKVSLHLTFQETEPLYRKRSDSLNVDTNISDWLATALSRDKK